MLQTAQNKHVVKTQNSNTSAPITVGGLFNILRRDYVVRGIDHMGIFNKKSAKELPPLFSEAELNGASYEQVIDFLVAVNNDDFKKVIKVAELQRKAHADMAKVTGLAQDEPQSIFDLQTIEARAVAHNKTDTEAGNFLDDDDDLTAAFMDDDAPVLPPAVPGTGTAKPITVTDDSSELQS